MLCNQFGEVCLLHVKWLHCARCNWTCHSFNLSCNLINSVYEEAKANRLNASFFYHTHCLYWFSSLFEFLWSFMVYIVLKNNFCLQFLWHDFPFLNPETVRNWNGWRVIMLHLFCNMVYVNKILLFVTTQSTYLHSLGICHRVANSCSSWQKIIPLLYGTPLFAPTFTRPPAPILITKSFRCILIYLNIFRGLSVRKFSFLLSTKIFYSLLFFNG